MKSCSIYKQRQSRHTALKWKLISQTQLKQRTWQLDFSAVILPNGFGFVSRE